METTLIVIIAILVILLITLVCVLIFFFSKMLKINSLNKDSNNVSIDTSSLLSNQQKLELKESKEKQYNPQSNFCIDHPELPAKGKCSISNHFYCELCITKEDEIKLARKFLDLYLDNEWEHLFFVNNEDTGADKLNNLVKVKKQIWNSEKLPIITQKQFKINIEEDRIEAFTMIKCRKKDSEYLRGKLSFIEKD